MASRHLLDAHFASRAVAVVYRTKSPKHVHETRAVVGHSKVVVQKGGTQRTRSTLRDYLIRRDSLAEVTEPKAGDIIEQEFGGGISALFEVTKNPETGAVYRWHDRDRTTWRIHSRETGVTVTPEPEAAS